MMRWKPNTRGSHDMLGNRLWWIGLVVLAICIVGGTLVWAADWYVSDEGDLYFSQDHNYDGLFLLDTATGNAIHVGVSGVYSGTVGLSPSPDPYQLLGSNPWDLVQIATDGTSSDVLLGWLGWGLEGLAYDEERDILYAINLGTFMILDSGTGSFIEMLPRPETGVQGLAYDPSRNLVYAIASDSLLLMAYDPSGEIWSTIGSTGLTWFGGGLAYDPAEDVLYAVGQAGGNNLYTIDPTTAAVSLVGPTGISPTTGGLAFLLWTIQQTIDAASPGDTIHIQAGTYQENLVVDRSVTIVGGGGQYIEPFWLGDVITITADGVTIDGLDVSEAMAWYLGMRCDGIHVTADGVRIVNSKIHDNADDGIEIDGNRARVIGNEIYGNDDDGIDLNGNRATIRGNEIYGNGDDGIDLDGNRARIIGNDIYGNGWGIYLSPGHKVAIIGNLIHDNEHDGILGTANDAVIRRNEICGNDDAGIDLYGNRAFILGNVILGNSDEGISLGGNRATIRGNTVVGNEWGVNLWDGTSIRVFLNVINGNHDGVDVGYIGWPAVGHTVLRYNAIEGNNPGGDPDWGGLWVAQGSTMVDAILNWWGSPDGPTQDVEGDGVAEYDGGGDWVIGPAIFSPWLGIDPDDDTSAPGVQLVSPMLIVVDEVGPPPTEGYLNAAIAGANSALLDGHDTIEVRPGTYDVDEEITDGVSILSTEGACETTLTGEIEIGTAGVLLGEIRNGFRIDGNVRVLSGQDASLSALHWNDIYGMVENAGIGTLDATYNFWGAGGPIVQTIGSVDVYPDLPLSSCTIIGYIDDDGMTVAEALIFGGMIAEGYSEAFARTATEIVMRCGIGNRQALGLILEYGHSRVKSALRRTRTCEEFYELLEGYAMPAGAGGAAPESVVVGEPLNVALVIVDPLTGDAVTDALVTVTVCREDVEPVEIAYFGVLPYDAETGMYGDAIDTTGWEPGTYRIYMGTDRMSWSEDVVEVTAP